MSLESGGFNPNKRKVPEVEPIAHVLDKMVQEARRRGLRTEAGDPDEVPVFANDNEVFANDNELSPELIIRSEPDLGEVVQDVISRDRKAA